MDQKPVWPDSDTASNVLVEGREAVQQAKRDGADFVKVYDRLPREAYFAIADEAKKQGIPQFGGTCSHGGFRRGVRRRPGKKASST